MDISLDFCIALLHLSVLHFGAPNPEPFKHSKSLGSLRAPSDGPKIGSVSGHSDLKTSPQALLNVPILAAFRVLSDLP